MDSKKKSRKQSEDKINKAIEDRVIRDSKNLVEHEEEDY